MLVRKVPEVADGKGDSDFQGKLYATRAAMDALGPVICVGLVFELQVTAMQHGFIDYLQVYEDEKEGLRVFVIDSQTYVTVMLADDY